MAKNIMFQGTGSSVGKSLLTAALCRILNDEGYKVAPFKSQNMALNSFITNDGKEMGRAQVVQAEAARVEPNVNMNPILLKPTSHVGSQVVLRGEVYSNMKAMDYYRNKNEFKPVIMECYNELDKNFDAIVLEGAGSPAEINLRENDIVNMGMAEMVDAPVILIGDIDKGGVFASIYGTVEILEKEESDRIKGFIINKFRGDVDILMPGIKMLEEKVKRPCLGVVPYAELNIEDEDSYTTRFDKEVSGEINVGVIKLPYMSNFTDITPLELEKDVSIKYIGKVEEFKDLDLVIIPGSKNTINDMKFIHNSGLDREIYKFHRSGKRIFGICGGYQILGREIRDPHKVESNIDKINGLSLLDVVTTMTEEKTTTRITGEVVNEKLGKEATNEIVSGYEIHMGQTNLDEGVETFIKLKDGRDDGAVNKAGTVFGTYLHGILDNDFIRRALLNPIREEKGIEITNDVDYEKLKDMEYDKLANIVKQSIDLEKIKEIMGL